MTSILAALALFPVVPPQDSDALEGHWLGTLRVSGTNLRLVIHVSKKEDSFSGTLDSPDQGATGIVLSRITREDRSIRIESKAIGAVYEGELSADGQTIKGQWKQGGAAFDLLMKKQAKAPDFRKPQEPRKPYPYDEEEVSYTNKKGGHTLAGTLTLPRSKAPHAAVILITGSGPQNRDENILGHKPFLIIADHLTRRGVAVLRVDDRGVGKSTGDFATATSRDFADDVRAGIDFLKTREDIDAGRIGLIGHSEGGIIAPMVAVDSEDVSFIILLAGPAVSGEEILYEQGELIARANGANEAAVKRNRDLQEAMYRVVKETKDTAELKKKLASAVKASLEKMTDVERKFLGNEDAFIVNQVAFASTDWFRWFLTYDPAAALEQVKCPLLALFGEKDLQVPPAQSIPPMTRALEKGGHSDYSVVKLANLNHLFQTSKSGSPAEYAGLSETFAPAALDTIGDWIERHVGKR